MGVSEAHSAAPVPERPTLATLREAIPAWRACELYAEATQPVMGGGRAGARLMLVAEQPRNRATAQPRHREDREGHPSSVLPARDTARAAAMDELVADLTGVGTWLAEARKWLMPDRTESCY